MSALLNLRVAINATYNISRTEKNDGYKDGDRMKLNKQKLKALIQEVLTEATEDDPTKLKAGAMTGGQFVSKGREQRVDADAEVDNQERSILNQIDQYLLGLAAKPGVDLQRFRLQIQTALKRLDAQISQNTQQGEEQ